MTWSAPSEATRSRFLVLHTPVTSAPNALAIWTAKVPTPPDAPLISTCCPGWIRPLSRSPCRAVSPATGTAAACSNDTLAGFSTSASSGTVTYSAKVPVPAPNTSSPGSKRVTFPPTASTTPARSRPSLDLGLRSPICGRATQGVPVMAYQSAGFTRRRMDPHQHLVVPGFRLVDLPQLEHLRRAEPVLDDRLHRMLTSERTRPCWD